MVFFGLNAQTIFEYPSSLKSDTLFVPEFELYPVPNGNEAKALKKKDLERINRRNKRINRANMVLERVLKENYPYAFKLISLSEASKKSSGELVLNSFSQFTRKMTYYYKDNPELLEELLDESGTQTPRFKDVYVYYYVAQKRGDSEREYVYVDFGKKNIPQALKYFCLSVVAYFE